MKLLFRSQPRHRASWRLRWKRGSRMSVFPVRFFIERCAWRRRDHAVVARLAGQSLEIRLGPTVTATKYKHPAFRRTTLTVSIFLEPGCSLLSFSLPLSLTFSSTTRTQCTGSPALSLFYSSHSLNPSSAHPHVSPSTSISTFSPLASVARIMMLAPRTHGLLVSDVPLAGQMSSFSPVSNLCFPTQRSMQPTSQPLVARECLLVSLPRTENSWTDIIAVLSTA